jgi:outer membrane lipoprotein-sorting protein
MNNKNYRFYLPALVFGVVFIAISIPVLSQDATEIVRKADALMRGEESSISVMTMKIVRPTWERTISFKSWTKGRDKSMVLITAPAKEKGQSFLKSGREMWNWNPTINRMIKLPPSMLSQGWMGSDFTNDDLLNESSIVVDYTHKLIGEETIEGRICYKIELIPLENAPVVWGKMIMWISKSDFLSMKSEYYDEDYGLEKTDTAYDIKTMGGRLIPGRMELIPADKPGNKTIVYIESIAFNTTIDESFFTQQNMQKLQ